jgi:hypothetical protein
VRTFRISILGLTASVLFISVAFVCLSFASELVAGLVLLPTLAILAMAILGVVYRRGNARAFWLGFALLGWGYMVLASGSWWARSLNRPELATPSLLDQFYPVLQRERNPRLMPTAFTRLFDDPDLRNRAIFTKLAERVSMHFPNDTPLQDLKKYIETSTQDEAAGLPTGIPIYLDASSRAEEKKYLSSPVSIEVEGVPLRVTLGLILKQLGLTYDVRDGLLTITKGTSGIGEIDTFRRVGHCFLALMIASMGGIGGLFFSITQNRVNTLSRAAVRSNRWIRTHASPSRFDPIKRFSLGTLMLVVVVAGLGLALAVQTWREKRREAEHELRIARFIELCDRMKAERFKSLGRVYELQKELAERDRSSDGPGSTPDGK